MTSTNIPAFAATTRRSILLEILFFVVLTQITKATISLVTWRYAGPITLVIILGLIFIYMQRKGHPLASIGMVRISGRKSWLLFLPQTIAAFVAILATGGLVAFIGETFGPDFMQATEQVGEQGDSGRFGDLAGNTPLYLSWLAILWVAGPAEELFFRGYLISRTKAFLGAGFGTTLLSVFLPALIFGLGHVYYQGWRGLFVTGAIGLTLGTLFLVYKRNLWPLMIAHASANSLVFTALYMQWDV